MMLGPRRVAAAFVALAGVLAAGACAHMRTAQREPVVTRFEVSGSGAAQYSTSPEGAAALRGPHASRVAEGLARVAAKPPLTPDGRLGELAERIARTLDAQGSPPPYAAIDLWARHLGLFEPAPHLLVLAQSDAARLPERVQTELEHMLAQQRYTHYGAATLERDGTVFCVLALSWRWASLHPVPRTLEPGHAIDVEGELQSGLHGAQLVVSLPDGTSYRSEQQQGPRLSLHAPTRAPGEYRVELLASSDLGETVVANFPVYVGVAPATYVDVAREDASVQLGETQAAERLLELTNRDRAHAGLAALSRNERLERVARAHSLDMQANNFIGHTSKTTGDAADRVQRAGIRTTLVLENIGRGYSPDEVHRGLMDSPGHRANVLAPEATDVGIGVVAAPEDQRTAYVVTELFARFARKIDPEQATDDLYARVNRERTRRGLRALEQDDNMSELCVETARRFFTEPHAGQQALLEQLNGEAGQKRLPYRRLGALMAAVSGIDEAVTIEALLDPNARALGLGLAQGTRPDTIDNAIAVVALIGY